MTKAVIDLGSLKAKLTLFSSGELVYSESFLTLMGKDLDVSGALSDHAVSLLTQALDVIGDICKQYKVDSMYVFATEAYRRVSNRSVVDSLVKKYLRSPIHQVSAEEEALLLKHSLDTIFGNDAMVVDIGGGSVQLAQLGNEADFNRSYSTGTYVLQQQFSPHNDIVNKQVQRAKELIISHIKISKTRSDIIVFGTTCMQDFIKSSFGSLDITLNNEKKYTDHDYYCTIDQLTILYNYIISLPPDKRTHLYPAGGYFIYGAEYLLLNIFVIAEQLKVTKFYPTNYNTSYAYR